MNSEFAREIFVIRKKNFRRLSLCRNPSCNPVILTILQKLLKCRFSKDRQCMILFTGTAADPQPADDLTVCFQGNTTTKYNTTASVKLIHAIKCAAWLCHSFLL